VKSEAEILLANKQRNLYLGLLFDGIGMLSFGIPLIGEFGDIVWAPIAGWLITKMYRGTAGKVAGVISFLEEAIPWTDFLPTFTLMWFYTYYIKLPESKPKRAARKKA